MADYTDIVDPDNGAGTDYTSLTLWEANAETDHSAGAGDTLTAQCRSSSGSDDTALVGISGNTVDSITIVGIDFPSDGIFDADKYTLNVTASAAYQYIIMHVDALPLTVKNIQIKSTGSNTNELYGIASVNSTSGDILIDGCIIDISATGGTIHGIGATYGEITVQNSIILNCEDIGIVSFGYNNANITAYNNVISGCGIGIERSHSGTSISTNNAVFNNTNDFNGTITIDHCASDDVDAGSICQTPRLTIICWQGRHRSLSKYPIQRLKSLEM